MFNFRDEVTEDWIKNELENIETQHSAHKAYKEIDAGKGGKNPDLVDIQKLFLQKLFRRCVAYRWLASSTSDPHPTGSSKPKKFNNISDSDFKSKGTQIHDNNKNDINDRTLSKIAVIERPDPRLPLTLTKEQVIADLVYDASSIKNLIEENRVHISSKNFLRLKHSFQDYLNTNIY